MNLKQVKKRTDDNCWFCNGPARMARSHVLLHCSNPSLAAARTEVWGGHDPRNIRVPLSILRREERPTELLGLSGVGTTIADGTDVEEARAARMDT